MHTPEVCQPWVVVQALIGNNSWSSVSQSGRLYHVGTIPNLKGNIYAADLRFMIGSSPEGFFPVAIYARRARLPLAEKLDTGTNSWDVLGTNLSFKVINILTNLYHKFGPKTSCTNFPRDTAMTTDVSVYSY